MCLDSTASRRPEPRGGSDHLPQRDDIDRAASGGASESMPPPGSGAESCVNGSAFTPAHCDDRTGAHVLARPPRPHDGTLLRPRPSCCEPCEPPIPWEKGSGLGGGRGGGESTLPPRDKGWEYEAYRGPRGPRTGAAAGSSSRHRRPSARRCPWTSAGPGAARPAWSGASRAGLDRGRLEPALRRVGRGLPDGRLAAAVVDRLTFRAHVIETGSESYRSRAGTAKKGGAKPA